jgi:limonene 1,2-monooxygenase
MALLRAEGPVTMETDWFKLQEARLQLPSFTRPHIPVAVAAIFTPSGPTAAGTHGIGILSVGGFDSEGFARTWQWAEEAAAQSGRQVNRADWRVVAPIHIAETREQAMADVRHGFRHRAYFGDRGEPGEGNGGIVGAALGLAGATIEEAMERGSVIVGSPDDACEAIVRIQERSGGFGGLMGLAHEWASPDRTIRSYELLARYVAPQFQGLLNPLYESVNWVEANGAAIYGTQTQAFKTAFADAGVALPETVKRGLGEGA